MKKSINSTLSFLMTMLMVANLYVSPAVAQDEGEDVVVEETTTTYEEPVEESSDTFTVSEDE